MYGNGLKKQLLWDACNKISNANEDVLFWGTGDETRDFIHVYNVVELFEKCLEINNSFMIINGGIGEKHTIKETVELIRHLLKKEMKIEFNNQVNVGNPQYYWSDMKKVKKLNLNEVCSFEDGLKKYVDWFESELKDD